MKKLTVLMELDHSTKITRPIVITESHEKAVEMARAYQQMNEIRNTNYEYYFEYAAYLG